MSHDVGAWSAAAPQPFCSRGRRWHRHWGLHHPYPTQGAASQGPRAGCGICETHECGGLGRQSRDHASR